MDQQSSQKQTYRYINTWNEKQGAWQNSEEKDDLLHKWHWDVWKPYLTH